MVRMYHLAEPSFLEEAVCLSIWQASCRWAAGQRYRHLPAPLGAERNADGDQGAAPTFVGPPQARGHVPDSGKEAGPTVPPGVLDGLPKPSLPCFAAFLCETYFPSVSECRGPGMDSVPFHIFLLPLPFPLHPPASVGLLLGSFWVGFHFLFFSPLSLFFSLFLLFLCLSFVKPSSFKIIEWWFFGWGNNTFLKKKKEKYLYQEAIFLISGNRRNHYFRLWKSEYPIVVGW